MFEIYMYVGIHVCLKFTFSESYGSPKKIIRLLSSLSLPMISSLHQPSVNTSKGELSSAAWVV